MTIVYTDGTRERVHWVALMGGYWKIIDTIGVCTFVEKDKVDYITEV